MKKIASCFLRWLNDKGYYYQSYGKNHKMPKIAVLVDNCGGQNKNNLTIHFLNIIKDGGFFWGGHFAFLYQDPHKELLLLRI